MIAPSAWIASTSVKAEQEARVGARRSIFARSRLQHRRHLVGGEHLEAAMQRYHVQFGVAVRSFRKGHLLRNEARQLLTGRTRFNFVIALERERGLKVDDCVVVRVEQPIRWMHDAKSANPKLEE